MAFKHGRLAAVWLGAYDVSTYFNDMSTTAEAETSDTTTFQSLWKTALAGHVGAKVDLKGLHDYVVAPTLFSTLGSAGDVLTVFPSGTAVADLARLLTAEATSYAESSPVGGIVAHNLSVLASGPVGFGSVVNPISDLGASPATSGYVDGLAATTTGWMAHLHVIAVSGSGSWVVKLVDSTASNFSDVADVSGGAFTTTAAPTSQRLVSAAGATLRRYVRCVATRTGGSSGDRITFGLALARNI